MQLGKDKGNFKKKTAIVKSAMELKILILG